MGLSWMLQCQISPLVSLLAMESSGVKKSASSVKGMVTCRLSA